MYVNEIEASLQDLGHTNQFEVDRINSVAKEAASLDSDPGSLKRCNLRQRLLHRSATSRKFPKTMSSWYAQDFVERTSEHKEEIDRLVDYMEYPDNIVYPKT